MGAKGNNVIIIYLGIHKAFDLEAQSVLRKLNNAKNQRCTHVVDQLVTAPPGVCYILATETIKLSPVRFVDGAASRQEMTEVQSFLHSPIN